MAEEEKDKEEIPATDGVSQGGTSQPGPPTEPNDENKTYDFSKSGDEEESDED